MMPPELIFLFEFAILSAIVTVCVNAIINRVQEFMLALHNADTESQVAILEAKARHYAATHYNVDEDAESEEDEQQQEYREKLEGQLDTIVATERRRHSRKLANKE